MKPSRSISRSISCSPWGRIFCDLKEKLGDCNDVAGFPYWLDDRFEQHKTTAALPYTPTKGKVVTESEDLDKALAEVNSHIDRLRNSTPCSSEEGASRQREPSGNG
jgi:hypothetical protein